MELTDFLSKIVHKDDGISYIEIFGYKIPFEDLGKVKYVGIIMLLTII